jgi:hypothetical protein
MIGVASRRARPCAFGNKNARLWLKFGVKFSSIVSLARRGIDGAPAAALGQEHATN